MTTWHRIDDHGIHVQFTYNPDQRGHVSLTTQEVEGLMRTGGWTEVTPTDRSRPMSTKRCPWWRGHDWQESGYDGVLTMRETCTRCGWHRTFNGATEESGIYPPGAFREATR